MRTCHEDLNDKAVKNDNNFLIVFDIQHAVFLTHAIVEKILDDTVQMSQRFLYEYKKIHSWGVGNSG